MIKILLGLVLGFLIGAGCRWFDIPAPSPPTLIGACLVVSVTLGYTLTDRLMQPRTPPAPTESSQPMDEWTIFRVTGDRLRQFGAPGGTPEA